MLERFYPKEYYPSIYAVDFEKLRGMGIEGLLIDIDNTLETHDIPDPGEPVMELMKRLKFMGFRVCLFSNNSHERVERFNRNMQLPYVAKAQKPLKKGVLRGLELLGTEPQHTAIIGDQLFTDVWTGNRCGLYGILVKPISSKDEWTVRLKRLPEKQVMKMYLKKVRNNEGEK